MSPIAVTVPSKQWSLTALFVVIDLLRQLSHFAVSIFTIMYQGVGPIYPIDLPDVRVGTIC